MVVDTSALYAIVMDEPERAAFGVAIKAAERRLVSAATAVECIAVFAGRGPDIDPMSALALVIAEFDLDIVPVDEVQWRVAADGLVRFGKGRHRARLNLGDAFPYALAMTRNEPLLCKGVDFAQTDVRLAL